MKDRHAQRLHRLAVPRHPGKILKNKISNTIYIVNVEWWIPPSTDCKFEHINCSVFYRGCALTLAEEARYIVVCLRALH